MFTIKLENCFLSRWIRRQPRHCGTDSEMHHWKWRYRQFVLFCSAVFTIVLVMYLNNFLHLFCYFCHSQYGGLQRHVYWAKRLWTSRSTV